MRTLVVLSVSCCALGSVANAEIGHEESRYLSDEKAGQYNVDYAEFADPERGDSKWFNLIGGGGKEHGFSEVSGVKKASISSLTLLAFLYFLNSMQDVFSSSTTTGRKRREVVAPQEEVGDYLGVLESYIDQIKGNLGNQGIMDGMSDGRSYGEGNGQLTVEARANRVTDFIGNILYKISTAFNFGDQADSRIDGVYDESNQEPSSAGFWSMFGSKIGQIATIMDFIDNPSPLRIGRSYSDSAHDEAGDLSSAVVEPSPLTQEDSRFLHEQYAGRRVKRSDSRRSVSGTSSSAGGRQRRARRYTDGMNVWYNLNAGNKPKQGSGGEGKIFGMVLNFLKNSMTTTR